MQKAYRQVIDMWLPLLGILIGIILGMVLPISIPTAYSSYMSIAVLAALDSVFGGIRASLEKNFQADVFISVFRQCNPGSRFGLYRRPAGCSHLSLCHICIRLQAVQ